LITTASAFWRWNASTASACAGGGLPDTLSPPRLHPDVSADLWRRAEVLARAFLGRLHAFSAVP
jgi:hypothetical protein